MTIPDQRDEFTVLRQQICQALTFDFQLQFGEAKRRAARTLTVAFVFSSCSLLAFLGLWKHYPGMYNVAIGSEDFLTQRWIALVLLFAVASFGGWGLFTLIDFDSTKRRLKDRNQLVDTLTTIFLPGEQKRVTIKLDYSNFHIQAITERTLLGVAVPLEQNLWLGFRDAQALDKSGVLPFPQKH